MASQSKADETENAQRCGHGAGGSEGAGDRQPTERIQLEAESQGDRSEALQIHTSMGLSLLFKRSALNSIALNLTHHATRIKSPLPTNIRLAKGNLGLAYIDPSGENDSSQGYRRAFCARRRGATVVTSGSRLIALGTKEYMQNLADLARH